jgi:hypothetical protein
VKLDFSVLQGDILRTQFPPPTKTKRTFPAHFPFIFKPFSFLKEKKYSKTSLAHDEAVCCVSLIQQLKQLLDFHKIKKIQKFGGHFNIVLLITHKQL